MVPDRYLFGAAGPQRTPTGVDCSPKSRTAAAHMNDGSAVPRKMPASPEPIRTPALRFSQFANFRKMQKIAYSNLDQNPGQIRFKTVT